MLLYFIPKLRDSKFIKFLSKFTASPWWILFISILVLCSATFGIEVYIYYAIAVLCGLIPSLLCEDMSAAIPAFAMCYMSFSRVNNNTLIEKSMFTNKAFIINLIVVAIICSVSLITRLVFDIIYRKRVYQFPRLSIGFAGMGLAMILGGLFTKYFGVKTALFGLVQIASLCITYYLAFYLVDWSKHKKDYFAWLVMAVGIVAIIQAVFAKYNISERIYHLEFQKEIFTGWGIRNNIGGQITFAIAGPFYLACKKKQPWIFGLIATGMIFGVCVTESRGAMLTSFGMIIVCTVLLLVITKKMQRIKNICAIAGIVVTLAILIPSLWKIYFHQFFDRLIKTIVESDNMDEFSSGRIEIYMTGLKLIGKYPFLGSGWYSAEGYRAFNFATGFYPSRWHNTIIQMGVTGGAFLLLNFAFHRFELVRKYINQPSVHRTFIMCSLAGFFISSLVDCFWSNIGPGLLYGILLAIFEMSYYTELSNSKKELAFNNVNHAPIAQLDRVLGFEPRGCGFESYSGRQPKKVRKHRKVKDLNLQLYLNSFFAYIEENNIKANDENSLKYELGIFLENNLPDYRVDLSKNVARYIGKHDDIVKHRVDIALISKTTKKRYAIQVSYPTKAVMADEMFKMVQNINYVEQLKVYGFGMAYLLGISEKTKYCVGEYSGVSKYFRNNRTMHGKIYKTKKHLKDDKFYKVKGHYTIKWMENNNNTYFYVVKPRKRLKRL